MDHTRPHRRLLLRKAREVRRLPARSAIARVRLQLSEIAEFSVRIAAHVVLIGPSPADAPLYSYSGRLRQFTKSPPLIGIRFCELGAE